MKIGDGCLSSVSNVQYGSSTRNTPVTWECRGRGLKSITDYFLVRRECMKDVKDVKVLRGADLFEEDPAGYDKQEIVH